MKAPVYHQYGHADQVRLVTLDDPTPGAHDIIVRVRAAVVSAADYTALRGTPAMIRLVAGLRRPKQPILGTDFAGVVAAVGSAVTRFQAGDHVAGATGATFGAHAELVRLPADSAVVPIPPGLDWVSAAALVDCTALVFLRDLARLQPGQTVVINGASGSVGGSAVQLAKYFGAQVIGTASTRNLDRVRDLGADQVVDYTRLPLPMPGFEADVVFDVAGTRSYRRCRPMLTPAGSYLTGVPSLRILRDALTTRIVGKHRASITFTGLRPGPAKQPDLAFQLALGVAGTLRPNVGATYPLSDINEAYRLFDQGMKSGTVVLTYT